MQVNFSTAYFFKRILIFFVLFFCCTTVINAQSWLWAKNSVGVNADQGNCVTTDAIGNVYVTGTFSSPTITFGSTTLTNTGINNIFLVKYNAFGTIMWALSAGNTGDDEPTSITTDAAGNVYMVGFFGSSTISFGSTLLTNSGMRNAFFAKCDSNGNFIWAKRAGGINSDAAQSTFADNNGNVYVAGTFSSPAIIFGTSVLINTSSDGSDNMFLAKYDTVGNVMWVRQGSGNSIEASSVATDRFGNVFVTGYFNNPNITFGTTILTNAGGYDLFIAKYNTTGTLQWAKTNGGTGDDKANALATDNNGNVFVTGLFYSPTITFGAATLTNTGLSDMFLAKYDSIGNIIWAKSAGGADTDFATSVVTDTSGKIFVAGSFNSSSIVFGTTTLLNAGGSDMFLTKYDTSGSILFSKKVGNTGWESAKSLAAFAHGNVYMTGYFGSPTLSFSATTLTNTGNETVFLAKFNDTAIRPDIITGIISVCNGSVTTLSNAITGGVWASNNTLIATIDATTGITTGILAGIDTISYTIGGYSVFSVITVNSFPVAGIITGDSVVCMFGSISLLDTSIGGIWHISNNNATISTSGVVTGVSAGLDSIAYIDSNSCGIAIATKAITINISPVVAAIIGLNQVCIGASITLSETSGGGTWQITNGDATITIGGIVNGVVAGIDTVYYYKSNTVCTTTVTKIVTINPLPNAGSITGATSLCVGATDTFIDSATGGTWGSVTPLNVTVNAFGVATGVLAGTAIIGYSVTNVCGGATAILTLTILPLANPGIITGQDSVCIGASITLTDTTISGIWSIQNTNATDSAGIVTGIVAGMDTLSYATTNSCGTVATTKLITILPLPYVSVIMGDSGLCFGGPVLTLSDSVTGGTWGTVNSVIYISGGIVSSGAVGIDTVKYSLTNMCGTAVATKTITVDLYPSAGIITGTDSMCAGAANVYSDGIHGGVWTCNNPSNVYVLDSLMFALIPGIDTIVYTVTNSCATVVAIKPIIILPIPMAGIISGPDTICLHDSVLFLPSAIGGFWRMANTNASVSASGNITGLVTGYDTIIYYVVGTCGTDTTSKPIFIKPLPTVALITGDDSLCIFSNLTLSDITPTGIWTASNTNVGIIDGLVTGEHGGVDTIFYTYTNSCGSAIATKTITIEPLPNPGIITGADSICLGFGTTLTESVTGGIWHSSTDTIATISLGSVISHAVGIDSILYTVSNSCGSTHASFVIKVMTTLTPTVAGRTFACVSGLGDTLIGTPLGGIWTCSNTKATISLIPAGGLVIGIATGYDTILYKTTNYCGTTKFEFPIQISEIVIPLITGINEVCKGNRDTLHGSPLGGIWSRSNIVASLDSIGSGCIVKGDTAGIDTIMYSIINICGVGSYSIPFIVHSKAYCDSINIVYPIVEQSKTIRLYPNPNNGNFTVELPLSDNTTITVFDMLGNELYMQITKNNQSKLIDVNLKNIKAGAYILKVEQQNQIYRLMFVINGK